MEVDKVFLEGVLNELHSLIEYKNNHLKSQISCTDLDEPDYHDYETCYQLQVIIGRISDDALTKREKWLMQQAWNQSKINDHGLDTWLNEKTEFYDATIENLLAHEGKNENRS